MTYNGLFFMTLMTYNDFNGFNGFNGLTMTYSLWL